MSELLPCPFCGGPASIENVKGKAVDELRRSAGCDNEECHGYMSMQTYPRIADAVKAWNTRHPEPAQAQVSDARIVDDLIATTLVYMSQFGQAVAAHGTAFTESQRTADERLRKAIANTQDAALSATPQPPPAPGYGGGTGMSEWRPIGSAPREGGYVLGFGDGPAIKQCCYVMIWRGACSINPSEGWVLFGSLDTYLSPTHWRSLPEPPK